MSYLLDTITLLWFLWDHPQLSANAKRLIENPSNQKFVSLVSCWEIAIKAGLGKLNTCDCRIGPHPVYEHKIIAFDTFTDWIHGQ